MTSPDLTRRKVLEAAAVTGGALVGGQLMPGTTPPAAAQGEAGASSSLEVALRVNGTEHRLTLMIFTGCR